MNKSAFIRSLPDSLKAQEVVDRAAAQGIKLSVAQVYVTRYSAKKKGTKGSKASKAPAAKAPAAKSAPAAAAAPAPAKRGPGRPPKAASAAAPAAAASAKPKARAQGGASEANFVTAALDLGLARAEELLRQVRQKLTTL